MNIRVIRGFGLMLAAVVLATAGSVNAQVRTYRATDAQMRTLIRRIETRTDNFRRQVDRYQERFSGQTPSDVERLVTEFETASDRLSTNFNARRTTSADAQEVLARASELNRYVAANRMNAQITNQWTVLRSDLDTLARYYGVSWNWNNNGGWNNNNNGGWNNGGGWQNGGIDARLTGTYRLNVSQSDNVATAIDRALGNGNDRQRAGLERRLTSPDVLVIDKRGQQVTMASSLSPQVSFNADGVERSETTGNGRTMSVRATANRSDLTIEYEGDRMNDFYVTFAPQPNGSLRVTRRFNLENRGQTVTVNSVYDKTDAVARWSDVPTQNNYPTYGGGTTGGTTNAGYVISNNTRMTATLDSMISTRSFRDGDTFTMTVTSPSQYRGAVIQGRVNGSKSGVVSGRANLAFDFDTIRLRDGSTYRFAGIVDSVREPDGDTVSVNNEGEVRDGNQTTKTVTRAGIGAALGAIIGAIAGGGQGAAIGAGIGAGAGAGSVVLQGRDNIELPAGTEFGVTASAPYNNR